MWNARLDEAQVGIKIARRNINNLRYAGDTTLMAESEEELKRLLMKVKEESEKTGLKLNIQKTKIMASGSITQWQIHREIMETVRDFMLGGSKITADGDCSHEIKRRLPLERKAVTNVDSVLKSRDITLPMKVHLVKAMVFPVVMYGCESWTIKKAECWRMLLSFGAGEDSWETLGLQGDQTSQCKGNQSWISIGSTDVEIEAPIIWPPDAKNRLIRIDPDEDWMKEKGMKRMRWLEGITDSMDMSLSKFQKWWWTGKLGVLQSMGWQRAGHNWATEQNKKRQAFWAQVFFQSVLFTTATLAHSRVWTVLRSIS